MRAQLSNRDYEQLSAYLDGQLAPGDQRRLEERLRARPELKTALDELSQTRALLRMAPKRRAPRNFTITPAMVGEQKPARRGGMFGGLFPVLSFASAVATLVLVATFFLELMPTTRPLMTTASQPDTTMMESAPQEEERSFKAAQEPTLAAEAARQEAAARAPEEAAPAAAAPELESAPQAAPTATPELGAAAGIAEAPDAGQPATGEAGSAPPVIAWGAPPIAGMEAYGKGGGGGGDGNTPGAYAPAPSGMGLGGGAGDQVYEGPSGVIVIPPEGIEITRDRTGD